jgi:hypothetical protein
MHFILAPCTLLFLVAVAFAQASTTAPVVVSATFGDLDLPLDLGAEKCVGLRILAICSAPGARPTEDCNNDVLAEQFCKKLGYSFSAASSSCTQRERTGLSVRLLYVQCATIWNPERSK